jgi:putative peptidoglycan lipid II flippase
MDKTQEKTIKTEKRLLMKIAKSTGGVTLILTGIKILGFIEKQVLAYYFGTGYQGDAYFVGFSLMIVFWDLSRGLMAPSYLPTLIEYRSKVGEAKSWEFTSTVFNIMSIIFIVIIGIGIIFTHQAVYIVAPGFVSQASLTEEEYQEFLTQFPGVESALGTEVLQKDRSKVFIDVSKISEEQKHVLGAEAFDVLAKHAAKRFELAVGMTRLMLTGAAFFAIAILTGLTLNSYKRFILAVADDVVFKISGFLGLVLLVRYIGIYGLGLGIALGSWLAPLIHLIGLRRQLPFYRRRIDLKLDPLRKMFRLIIPLIVGTTCIESRRLIDNFFASKLRVGSVTALAYGYKLIEFAYVAIAEPLAVVVFPYFSDLAIQKDHEKLTEILMTTLRTVILIFTPLGVCLFALRYPVVRLLFERGEFDTISTQLTVTALTYYSLGIVCFAVDVILLRFYFSMSDTKTPAIMEVITLAIHVAVIYIFIGVMDHGSIALAFTLSKTIKVLVLYGLLKRKIEDIQLPHNLQFFGKIIIAVGIMLTMMSGYHGWYVSQFDLSSLFQQALFIGSSGSLGALTFFIVTIVLKVQEVRLILRAVSDYVRR